MMPTLSWAAKWSVTPSLTLSETYTSNVNIGGVSNEQSEFITQINPAITLTGTGRRLQLDLSYNMQNVLYAKNASRNTTFHQLRAHALATLVKDALFVDTSASISQQAISLREAAPVDNLTLSNNRTDAITFHISPYLRHAFGDVATTELRYGYDKTHYEATGFGSESNSYSARITSGATFKTFPWGLGYSRRETPASKQVLSPITFETYTADLRYVASRKLTFTTSGGYENNEYGASTLQRTPSGVFWNAGLIWSPSGRTSLQASYGKRFFGNNYALRANHVTRRSTWNLSYTENVTTINMLRPESRIFMISDGAGDVFIDPQTGLPILIAFLVPTLTNEVYISKGLQAFIGYKLKRNDFNFSLFKERRVFERSGELQRLQGANVSWALQLAPHSNLSINSGSQNIEYSLDNQADDFWHIGMTLGHDIQRDIKGAIDFRHAVRNSNRSINESTENRITARVTVTF